MTITIKNQRYVHNHSTPTLRFHLSATDSSVRNMVPPKCFLHNMAPPKCFLHNLAIARSSRLEVFCKKDVLKNTAKITGKHICQSLFFSKVAGLRLTTLSKKRLCSLAQVFHNAFQCKALSFSVRNLVESLN